MDKVELWKKASRSSVLPVILLPVAIGALGAYAWNGVFHPLLFVLTLLGSAAAHLFSNMINDLWDYRNGTDTKARESEEAISTNSGFLTNGTLSESTFAAMTWTLFAVAAVCGIVLAVVSGWPVLVFGGLGALIAYYYVAPPIRFGYRGKGYSEAAILIAFGVLPVAGSYYVQTSLLDWKAIAASLPIGLFTTLILFNHHFLHWQADKEAGKRTLVVVWGEQRALRFSFALLMLVYAALIGCVLAGALPWYSLLALLTVFPVVRVYRSLGDRNPSRAYAPLMGASVQGTMRFGLLLVLALLVQGLLAYI
ncbi:1,4-dihydroxy-2-naphthoate octaprenyltransferase [Paenibacillus sp. J31TS4]|uniref:prenyltransferase n=1 Tax=Paenibacillus sp. J31TS4 TaxID=2807195 RepID=UPI001B1D8C87|nr:prenyltransferase [Paenibacillus sp. J31TS4]GIP38485.1 1,4-dihydroxy-2-naphthoate octaprenyltransferase [Paenibacillus sp. J31TS4]